MERRAIWGRSALLIIGSVFSILGGSFLILGVAMLMAGSGDASFVGSIFSMLGSAYLVLGIVFLGVEILKKKRNDKLMASGRYIWAEVVDCVPNLYVRISGRNPYHIVARYRDSRGVNHIFKSPPMKIFKDPELIGKQVKVYYKDETFRHYYLDAAPILPQFIEH